MGSTAYQGQTGRLLHDVASPEVEEEEAVTENPNVGQVLRDAVAEVLHVDPETLRPRR